MELTDVRHNINEVIDDFHPDIFIAASGHEERSVAIPQKFINLQVHKLVLASTENKSELFRPANDAFFKENGFSFIYVSAFKGPDFKGILGEQVKPGVKILLDITAMPGLWYHAFLNYIIQQTRCRQIDIRITYIPSEYVAPSKAGKKIQLQESPKIVSRKNNSGNNSKKSALIMGLGREKSISNKVYEIIQPEVIHLLYADPAIDAKNVEHVLVNNHSIISKTPIRNLHSYSMYDSKKIYDFLIDLVMPLRLDMHVIIIPLGPKIFTLMSVLLQITYPDIELYYPQYKIKPLKNRKASSDLISVDLTFSVY